MPAALCRASPRSSLSRSPTLSLRAALCPAEQCAERGHEWSKAAAEAGEPVASFLHAQRVHLAPGVLYADARRERATWLRRAADAGFGRAMSDLGQSYRTGDGVPRDEGAAEEWFRAAIGASGEADAHFNLGQMLISRGEINGAVAHFGKAAVRGSQSAMENMGVAHLKGAGGVVPDAHAAAAWFEASGTANGMHTAARLHRQAGRDERARRWLARAANAGHEGARGELDELWRAERQQAAAAGPPGPPAGASCDADEAGQEGPRA
jgi:TPR repeat protein